MSAVRSLTEGGRLMQNHNSVATLKQTQRCIGTQSDRRPRQAGTPSAMATATLMFSFTCIPCVSTQETTVTSCQPHLIQTICGEFSNIESPSTCSWPYHFTVWIQWACFLLRHCVNTVWKGNAEAEDRQPAWQTANKEKRTTAEEEQKCMHTPRTHRVLEAGNTTCWQQMFCEEPLLLCQLFCLHSFLFDLRFSVCSSSQIGDVEAHAVSFTLLSYVVSDIHSLCTQNNV